MTSRIRKGRAGNERSIRDFKQEYGEATRPTAENLQDMLVRLIGSDGAAGAPDVFQGQVMPGSTSFRNAASRMAMDDNVVRLLQALPAAAAVGGVVGAGDIIAGEESFANKGMDILGMGAGAYGINRGVNGLGGTTRAGRALAMAAGLGIGKMGSDAVQGGIGGIL